MITGRLEKYEPLKGDEAKLSIYVKKSMMPEVLPLADKEVAVMARADLIALPEGSAPEIDERLILLRELMTDVGRIYHRLVDLNYPKPPETQDLITAELEPLPITAADEFPATLKVDWPTDLSLDAKAPVNEFYGEKD